MTTKAVRLPTDLYDALKTVAKARKLTVPKLIRLLAGPQPPVTASSSTDADPPHVCPTVTAISAHTLEDCARAILTMLPNATKDFAFEICERILNILPSQLIFGHLMAAADAGYLQAPKIDSTWLQAKAQEVTGESVCEWEECGQRFAPVAFGQRYCSNVCGGKAATLLLPPREQRAAPVMDAYKGTTLIQV